MASTRVVRHLDAPRARVYRALTDAAAVARWKVPRAMRAEVHHFEAREGGAYRVTLTYDAGAGGGKTTEHSDSYHGRFVTLVPDERVVEAVEFESDDPAMRGEMLVTTTLADVDGGTELVAVHDGLPPGVRPEDNELGWNEALDRLAELVQRGG